MMTEAGPQTKTVRYARSKDFLTHRNYFGPGAEAGWPDVEIFLPGSVLFIEFKSPGKVMRKLQRYRADWLRNMGHRVETCYTFEEAKRLIDDIC